MQKLKDMLTFISGLVVGGLAGGILTQWLAPRSGEANREKIQEKVTGISAETQQIINEQIKAVWPNSTSLDDKN